MRMKWFVVLLTVVLISSAYSCAHQPVEPAKENMTRTVFNLTGIAGQSLAQPSPNMVVALMDKATGLIISEIETDFSGRFHFQNLSPGVYVVSTGDVEKEVRLTNEDQNVFLKITACECCPKY